MPVKPGLELMPVVGTDRFNSERKFFNHKINKVNRTVLCMPAIDFKRSDACTIVDGSVLEAFDSYSVLIVKK